MIKNKTTLTKARTERRAVITLIAFMLFCSLLLVNILRLDLFAYDMYREKAYDQITTTSTLRAERGNIYDANMNLLATTKTTWRIFVSPRDIASKTKDTGTDYADIIAKGLADILSLDHSNLYKKISNSKVLDVTIDKSAEEPEYQRVISLISQKGLDGLVFTEAQVSRYYPEGSLAAHVLGFSGSDNQGLYGLEYYYDRALSGTDGYYLYAKDANGKAMPGAFSTTVPAINGNNLITTIDMFIQEALEEELENILINHNVNNRACGIVMDTNTGAILAMASSSPFNPNEPYILDAVSQAKLDNSGFTPGSEEYKGLKNELMQTMWSNKCVSETYEPGSTFKIVTVSAALDSGAATMTDKFSCNGYHTVGGWRIKCHKTTGHGSGFSLAYGLQMSCNPTMMTIAERIGAERFYSYVDAFGYFEKTGIDLPSESRTIFHKLENIGSTELATASFGQRFKVSIISQLTAVAAVANGGRLVEPYIVDKIIDENGNIISQHKTTVKRQVISENVANEVAKVLAEGVSGNGGAKNAYVDGYEVAAKTGTSQKFDILDENGNSYLRIGSTVAFVPGNDSGIAVIIVVDEPQTEVKYGSTVAAPYISSLLTKVLPYLEYEKSTEPASATVGNYVGMNINSVKKALNNSGISYEIVGNGSVAMTQCPAPGVDITLSLSKVYIYTVPENSDAITIPNFVGLNIMEANRIATNLGLNIHIVGVTDATSNILEVVSQSLPPNAKAKKGAVIEFRALRTDFED